MSPIDCLALGVLILLLIPVVLVDLRERRIPNTVNLALAVTGLLHATAQTPRWITPVIGLGQVTVSLLLLAGTAWITRRISPRAKIGWGDLKFLAAASAWVGLDGMVLVLLIASLLGLATGLVARQTHGIGLRELRPFGPMLAAGLLGVVVFLFLHGGASAEAVTLAGR